MTTIYASDATFQDTMARLAGTDVPFSEVWPVIRTAINSGRAPNPGEYSRLNGFIAQADAARHTANAALSQPKVFDGKAAIARPVGVGQVSTSDAESGPKSAAEVIEPSSADTAQDRENQDPAALNNTEDQPIAKPPETPKPA